MINHINKDTFEKDVLKNKKLILVDFFATWCGPCQMLAPVLEKISNERSDIEIVKIDIDENMETAIKYGIDVVPTLKIFKNGTIINSLEGFKSEKELIEEIEKCL